MNEKTDLIKEIERSVNTYAGYRDHLLLLSDLINSEIKAVIHRHRNTLLKRIKAMNKAKTKMQELIEQNKKSFRSPKTRELYGVKFGIRKQPDKLLIDDEAKTVERINRHHKALATIMLDTRVSVVKNSLNTLNDRELKVIGVMRQYGEDCVVIKDAKSDQVTKITHYLETH